MTFHKFLLFVAIAMVSLQPMAKAQENPALPKEAVEQLARIAHNAMAGAKLSSGELIGEERAKTLQYPLVPYKMIEFVVLRGHLAGFAAACGLDWEKGFYRPLMGFLRGRETAYTDYQWAYVGTLHGVSMGAAEKAMAGKTCEPQMKENLLQQAK